MADQDIAVPPQAGASVLASRLRVTDKPDRLVIAIPGLVSERMRRTLPFYILLCVVMLGFFGWQITLVFPPAFNAPDWKLRLYAVLLALLLVLWAHSFYTAARAWLRRAAGSETVEVDAVELRITRKTAWWRRQEAIPRQAVRAVELAAVRMEGLVFTSRGKKSLEAPLEGPVCIRVAGGCLRVGLDLDPAEAGQVVQLLRERLDLREN